MIDFILRILNNVSIFISHFKISLTCWISEYKIIEIASHVEYTFLRIETYKNAINNMTWILLTT